MKPMSFLIIGSLLVIYLLLTGYMNFSLISLFDSGSWGPAGRSTYHK